MCLLAFVIERYSAEGSATGTQKFNHRLEILGYLGRLCSSCPGRIILHIASVNNLDVSCVKAFVPIQSKDCEWTLNVTMGLKHM